MRHLTNEQVWKILEDVQDPEIPVISVVDLGLIRQVAVEADRVLVVMTLTFAGCPALQVMREEIARRLQEAGASQVEVRITHKPPWSSDWITEEGRRKLKDFGLAPPPRHNGAVELALQEAARCPYCASQNTQLKNSFGPTLCRAIYVCNDCRQPFEQFKPV